MKKNTAKLIPLLGKASKTSAAVATGLLSPAVLAAPGDLDPGFGDLGRLGPILNGPAWSLETLDDGTILLGGGDMEPACDYYNWYCYYSSYFDGFDATNFVSMFSPTGVIDASFIAATIADTQVLDIVRQPGGEVVAVGRKVSLSVPTFQLTAFRLRADGELDSTFGTDGVLVLPAADYGLNNFGTSIVLDPDGRIVIAGSQDEQLIVLRLLPNGSLDDTFGTSGVFTGPENLDSAGAYTKILRTGAGGYRVSTANAAGCQLVALTSDGTLDSGFGIAGISTIDTPSGPATSCSSVVTQPDGRLLVAGSAVGNGFATRLLANGQSDPGFSASAVASATALAVGDDGSIAVANAGVNGTEIMRLLADGTLDVLFGNAGSTVIDLASDGGTSPIVYDLTVRPDGSVVGAGGDEYSGQAFVVQLLGSGDSPGVLGVTPQGHMLTAEGAAEAVVNVRRTGGEFGTVSVAYRTIGSPPWPASESEDYTAVSGRLTWDDGDRTDKEVRVPILSDSTAELPEFFKVRLSDAQGGAGIGMRDAMVEIAADGDPFGQFQIEPSWQTIEEPGTAYLDVYRNFYFSGAVSVTLTPKGGAATAGDDFAATPVTLSWADGEGGSKSAIIAIHDDSAREQGESFVVELSDPTGGAVIGPTSSARILILANDQPLPESGGSGALGFLSLFLLGAMRLLRAARTGLRSRMA